MASAWDKTQGQGITVAVIDTGVDYTHPDLAANVWTNPSEIPDNGIDDDHNGFIDDVKGWDFADQDNEVMDRFGHGTHVSGTIAAVGNNRLGIIGVAPKAKIMAVKGIGDDGSGQADGLAQAIRYAVDNGADVLNNSWGCWLCPVVPVFEDAVRYAHELGAVVVFAAGNADDDIINRSPQNLPETIVVSAVDQHDQKTYFSSFGLVDVAAPGGGPDVAPPFFAPFRNILSLKSGLCDSGLCDSTLMVGHLLLRQAGTSMAAPHVAGLAALILALHPAFTVEQLRQAMRHGSDDVGETGFDAQSGYGRINAATALAESSPLEVLISQPYPWTLTGIEQVEIRGTANGPDFASWQLAYGAGTSPTAWTPIVSSTAAVVNGLLTTWDLRSLSDDTYTLRLTATNVVGQTFEDRHRVVVDQVVLSEPDPTTISVIRGGQLITVRGTVLPAHFSRYTLKILTMEGEVVTNAAITVTDGGRQKVSRGVLGSWDTTHIKIGHYRVTLEVTLTTGQTIVESAPPLPIDPTLHPGWPVDLGIVYRDDGGQVPLSGHLAAADLNGDGKAELLVGWGSTVRIFDHTGAMLPGWPQSVNQRFEAGVESLAVGDLTGDGAPDVVATNGADTFVWRADGTLLPGWPKPLGFGALSLAIDDINGDGANDLIVKDVFNDVWVFNKDGAALPGWSHNTPSFDYFGESPVAMGDVNGDGKKEIVVVKMMRSPTSMVLFLFSAEGKVLPGWPKAISSSLAASGIRVFYPLPAMGDLDGDGKLEIVIGSSEGRVYAFHGDGTAVAGWPQRTKAAPVNPVAVGDLDGDGKPEVVAGNDWVVENWAPVNYLFAWHGDGRLLPGWPVTNDRELSAVFFGFGAPALADLDGDGRADVIVSRDSVDMAWTALYAYRADGTLVSDFPKPTTALGTLPISTAAIADLDGDGLLELAWVDFNAMLYVWDLPGPTSGPQPWPMFRGDERRSGRSKGLANRPPVLAPIGDQTVKEGQPLTFTVSASDPDKNPVVLSARLANGNAIKTIGASFTDRGDGTGLFRWTPTYSKAGSYQVLFEASDGKRATSELITITVTNVNRAPVFSPLSAQTVKESEGLTFTISASDPDGDALTYAASPLPSGASFNASTQTFAWTPGFDQARVYPVTFSVSDGSRTATAPLTITVTNVNRAPTLSPIGAKTIPEDKVLSFTVSGSDPDGNALTYTASPLPAGARFNPSTKFSTFIWRPNFTQAGSYPLTVTVSDGTLSAGEPLTLTVTNVNRAPTLSPIGAKTIPEDKVLSFTVSGSDPDGDALTYTTSPLPSGASFNPSTKTFAWTPRFDQAGRSYPVTFMVSDGSRTARAPITIAVTKKK